MQELNCRGLELHFQHLMTARKSRIWPNFWTSLPRAGVCLACGVGQAQNCYEDGYSVAPLWCTVPYAKRLLVPVFPYESYLRGRAGASAVRGARRDGVGAADVAARALHL